MDPECVLIIFRSIVFVCSTHARVWVEVLWSEVKSLAVCFVKILSESRNAALFYIDFLDFFFFFSLSLSLVFLRELQTPGLQQPLVPVADICWASRQRSTATWGPACMILHLLILETSKNILCSRHACLCMCSPLYLWLIFTCLLVFYTLFFPLGWRIWNQCPRRRLSWWLKGILSSSELLLLLPASLL